MVERLSNYPRFTAGECRLPLEDGRGVPVCEVFVRAVSHPRHREHAAVVRWYGGPADIGAAESVAGLVKLTRRRTLGRAAMDKMPFPAP